MDITRMGFASSTQVRLSVTDAPDTPVKYSKNLSIAPDYVVLSYTYRRVELPTGHTFDWVCTDAAVRGPRLLKPGKDGKRRVSDTSSHLTNFFSRADLATDPDTPPWLPELVNRFRPTGMVTVEGSTP